MKQFAGETELLEDRTSFIPNRERETERERERKREGERERERERENKKGISGEGR